MKLTVACVIYKGNALYTVQKHLFLFHVDFFTKVHQSKSFFLLVFSYIYLLYVHIFISIIIVNNLIYGHLDLLTDELM